MSAGNQAANAAAIMCQSELYETTQEMPHVTLGRRRKGSVKLERLQPLLSAANTTALAQWNLEEAKVIANGYLADPFMTDGLS